MAEVLLNDLAPNSKYVVQVRAVSDGSASQWSPSFEFTTIGDSIAPSPISGLSWTVQGTSFLATWNAPTTDSDGKPLKDLSDYVVTITAASQSKEYVTAARRLDFTYEMNQSAFEAAQPSVQISVRARDVYGNQSTPVTATALNAPPSAPSSVAIDSLPNAVNVRWNPSPETDLDRYEVHMYTVSGTTLSSATLVFTGKVTSTTVKVSDTSTRFFKVVAFDTFGNSASSSEVSGSAAGAAGGTDTTPPGEPTSVSATSSIETADPSGGTANITVSWTAPLDSDLFGYKIRYRKTGTTNWSYMDIGKVTSAVIANLRSGTQYDIDIASYDVYNNQSAWVTVSPSPTAAVDTSAPAQVLGLVASPGVKTITVSWSESTETDVINSRGDYQIERSTASDFSANLLSKRVGSTVTTFADVTSGTTYYFRVRAYDTSGNAGAFSATVSTTAGSVTNAEIVAGTISGDRVVAGSITGTQIQAGSVEADRLKANTAFVNALSIQSKLTINAAAGSIESSNYNQASKTGFRLSQTSLDIYDGSIEAKALKLQNGANLLPPQYSNFEGDPSFYTIGKGLGSSGALSVSATNFYTFMGMKVLSIQNTSGATQTMYLSRSSSDYPARTAITGTYIASVYILQDSGAAMTGIGVNLADSGGVTTSTIASIPNFTWIRHTVTRLVANAINGRIEFVIPTGKKIFIACPQYELQLTAETSPSPWKPSGVTSLDGSSITTGQIRSSNYVAGSNGWMIDTAGNAEFASGTFRGNVAGAAITGSSFEGGSLTIPSNTVYNAGAPAQYLINPDQARFSSHPGRNLLVYPSFESIASVIVTQDTILRSLQGDKGPRLAKAFGKTDKVALYGVDTLKIWNYTAAAAPGRTQIHGCYLEPSKTYTFSFHVAAGNTADTVVPATEQRFVKFNDLCVYDSTNSVAAGRGVDTRIELVGPSAGKYADVRSSTTASELTNGPGWTRRWSKTFTTPAFAEANRLFYIQLPAPCLADGSAPVGLALHWDGFQIEEGSTPTRYIDGDQPDCVWDYLDQGEVAHETSSSRLGSPTFWVPSYADAVLNTNLTTGDLTATRLRLGSGSAHGTNYVQPYVNALQPTATGQWQPVVNVADDPVQTMDDGDMHPDLSMYVSQSPGVYVMCMNITWSNITTGYRGLQIKTSGGTVIATDDKPPGSAVRAKSMTWVGYLPGNGYWIRPEVYQNSGGVIDLSLNAAGTPCRVFFAQLL